MVDEKMQQKSRSQQSSNTVSTASAAPPKIQQQFSDLKRQLASVSNEEWANIPEVGDLTRKRSRKNAAASRMADRFTPVPDSVLLSSHRQSELSNSLGSATPAAPSGAEVSTDFAEFGQARDRVLGLKLDQIKDSVSGSSTVDPRGYLTDLGSIAIKVCICIMLMLVLLYYRAMQK
jgi:pre-mRNA-processing factor 6